MITMRTSEIITAGATSLTFSNNVTVLAATRYGFAVELLPPNLNSRIRI